MRANSASRKGSSCGAPAPRSRSGGAGAARTDAWGFAALLAGLLLAPAAGCLSSPAKPFPQEGPIRSTDRKVEVEIERFTSFDGKGGVYTGGLVRARHRAGPLSGSTVWVARLDPGDEQDVDATLPAQGLLTIAIEGRAPDEVIAVKGPVGRPQRFRLADGVRVEE